MYYALIKSDFNILIYFPKNFQYSNELKNHLCLNLYDVDERNFLFFMN